MKVTASCLLTGALRTTTLAIATALAITWATLPAVAQSAVPSSATQAAKMPQYASRLAPPGARPPSRPHLWPRQGSRIQPPNGPIYDNGPINGTVDAYTINFGFVISNSITVEGGSITGMMFGAWLFPGDVLESAEVSITSSEFGGTTYFDQSVSFSPSGCVTNPLGFDVCIETSASFSSPTLQPGTYWVNLQNASVNTGDPVYWDENSGVGCSSPGCPSLASENTVGTIPSEAFTMEGDNPPPPTCYQPQGNLQIIASLNPQQGGPYPGPSGVTIDNAGNLYGTTGAGGNHDAGFAYKLAHFANWLVEPLFNFAGGNNGGQPANVTVGSNGSLYGGAQGGIQNCGSDGSQYCGLVYNLKPKPNPCNTVLCGWNESVPYRFTSESDGSGVINVSAKDQQGNVYGTTSTGGAYGAGTVFELSPSGGGWTKSTLHSFTGGSDGANPQQVLLGPDGNLYGLTSGGGVGGGIVFQLTPSGGQWTESIIHAFGFRGDIGNPSNLVQDGAGNLYGIANEFVAAAMFTLQKRVSGWGYSVYFLEHGCQPQDLPYEFLSNLTVDSSGTLYGTGGGGENFARSSGTKPPGGTECSYRYIFQASNDSSGWHYHDLWFRDNVIFASSGSLAVDASGNLYGTTPSCGTYNAGTVWQLSP